MDSDYKVRLSSVIALCKLAKQDSSFETLVVRDQIGMLKDNDKIIRELAALCLSNGFRAKIAIPYIQEIIMTTNDSQEKERMQNCLRKLK